MCPSVIVSEITLPQLIEHIDAIARKAGRDVLYLTFLDDPDGVRVQERWDKNPSRKEVVAWLDANGYEWSPCGEMASDKWMVEGYRGSIYIATPFDRNNGDYIKLEQYLEHPGGALRLPKMRFWVSPLSLAMQNVHHDELGYWEMRAESF